MAELEACVSWSFEDADGSNYIYGEENNTPSYDCCLFTLPTTVKNCGDFRVYHIGPTQACSIAYCSAPETNSFNISQSWLFKPLHEQKPATLNQVDAI